MEKADNKIVPSRPAATRYWGYLHLIKALVLVTLGIFQVTQQHHAALWLLFWIAHIWNIPIITIISIIAGHR